MNVKMVAGILLVCAVASIFFVAPIQAYLNEQLMATCFRHRVENN